MFQSGNGIALIFHKLAHWARTTAGKIYIKQAGNRNANVKYPTMPTTVIS